MNHSEEKGELISGSEIGKRKPIVTWPAYPVTLRNKLPLVIVIAFEIQTNTLGHPWFFPSLKKGEGFCLFVSTRTYFSSL